MSVINDAVAARNWPLLAVAILVLVVPMVLVALGKNFPVVSQIADGLLAVAVKLFAKKPATTQAAVNEVAKGVAAVAVVEEGSPEEKTK